MAPSRRPTTTTTTTTTTKTTWTTDFDTLRRESLFRNPPKDRSAYPALAAAIEPHVESFNAIFRPDGGLLEHALRDIGTKIFLDGDPSAGLVASSSPSSSSPSPPPPPRNRLSVRIREVFLDKSVLPGEQQVCRAEQGGSSSRVQGEACELQGEDAGEVGVQGQ